jgi:hypothetical protein
MITALGNWGKRKRREDTKSVIGPTEINGKIVAGGKHPQSISSFQASDAICPPAVLRLPFQCSVLSAQQRFHQIWSSIVSPLSSVPRRSRRRFRLNLHNYK